LTDLVHTELSLSPRSQAKRKQIIEAAQTLFLRDGYSRTSMDAIRVEAQVSKPTLYNHFDCKENLFIGIIEQSLDEVSATWGLISSEKLMINSQEQLRQILFQFASAAVNHLLAPHTVSLARTLLAETSTFPELGRNFRDRITRRVITMLSTVLTTAHDQGVVSIKRERIPAAVRFFTAQFLSYLLIDGLLVGGHSPEVPTTKDIETIVDLYLEMIC